jgi:hypothetical protein
MLVFANPTFLWALTAAAIPLMLHMFQRRRTVVTPFPTLRFLKAAQKRSSSRVRFENFLLWLLRTLLLLALGFAFAMPLIRTTAAGSWLSRTRRDVAIVIDASYSMNYELDRGKVWEVCKDAAASIIGGLLPGDRVCVYLAAETPVPVIEKPTTEHATVIQAINALKCLPGSSKIDEAVAAAIAVLEQQEGRREREVYVMTDGQALPWQGFRDAAKKDETANTAGRAVITREQRDEISLFALLAGAKAPENAWPSDVKVSPLIMLAGQTARLKASVGRSGSSKEITLGLEIAGQERGKRSVTPLAESEADVEFVVNGLEPGIHVARITTPADALPEDDEFLFLVRVRKQLPALIVGPQNATRYLKAALAPGASDDGVRQIDAAEFDSVDLRDYQAVFLCDAFPLAGQAILRLEEYAHNGGVVIVFPGDRAEISSYGEMHMLPAQPESVENIPAEIAARPLRRIANQPGQVVNFNMSLPPGTVPTVALKRIMRLGALRENAAVLVTAGDDTPLLTGRAVGRGRVFMFTVSADRDWSTLPLTAFFLPVAHQLIRQGAGASVQPPHVVLGIQQPVNEIIPEHREDDVIVSPSGSQLALRDSGNRVLVIENLSEPGIYTRTRSGAETPEPVMAVNTDRTESRLTPLGAAELNEWTSFKKLFVANDPEELAKLVDEYRNGRSLAEMCLWLAMLLALLEWWFANRVLRKQIGASEKLTVDLAGKVVAQ